MKPNPGLIRDRGATLMLEIVQQFMAFDSTICDWFWETYRKRLPEEREEVIAEQLKLTRFSLVYRAGRDRDWIRSYNRYGVPPVRYD